MTSATDSVWSLGRSIMRVKPAATGGINVLGYVGNGGTRPAWAGRETAGGSRRRSAGCGVRGNVLFGIATGVLRVNWLSVRLVIQSGRAQTPCSAQSPPDL